MLWYDNVPLYCYSSSNKIVIMKCFYTQEQRFEDYQADQKGKTFDNIFRLTSPSYPHGKFCYVCVSITVLLTMNC